MPHPGYGSVCTGHGWWGPTYALRSNTGRKNCRRARRRARRLGYRLRAAKARGGLRAFIACALDAMRATPAERMGFGLMGEGSDGR